MTENQINSEDLSPKLKRNASNLLSNFNTSVDDLINLKSQIKNQIDEIKEEQNKYFKEQDFQIDEVALDLIPKMKDFLEQFKIEEENLDKDCQETQNLINGLKKQKFQSQQTLNQLTKKVDALKKVVGENQL